MSEPRWLDDREQRAWRSLMLMQADLSQYMERHLRRRDGLSSADYEVLAHLSEAPEGRLRALHLGKLLRWDKSRLSQHLTRMEKRGLVTRERCPSDQRGAVAVLTPAGRSAIESAAPAHVEDVRSALIDHLTPEQLDLLGDLAEQVCARLEELEREA